MLERVGNKKSLALTHRSLGEAHEKMGHTDLAFAHYEKAGDLYRMVGVPKGEASVLSARGALF